MPRATITIAGRAIVIVAALVGLTLATPAVVDAASSTTLAVPSSIDATGGSDVTNAFAQFFRSVPEGATIVFPKDARYRVEGVVRIQNVRGVTIAGNDATIFADTTGKDAPSPGGRFRQRWPRLREHVSIRNATGLTIRDLNVRGPNDDGRFVPALEGQAGFAIARSTDVVLDNVAVQATHGDGVYVAGQTDDVTVRNSSFETIGRQGIAVVSARNVVIERSTFNGIARSVFDIEPAVPRWKVDSVRMRDNEIGDYRNFALAAGGAGADVTDLWFERNHVTGGNGLAIFAGFPQWLRRGLHIIDNTSAVPGRNVPGEQREGVIQIARFDSVEIRGNEMEVEDGPAITLADVCDADVGDNAFPGASQEVVVSGSCDRRAGAPRATPPSSGRGSPVAPSILSPSVTSATSVPTADDGSGGPWGIALVPVAIGAGALLLVFVKRRPDWGAGG